MVLHPDGDDARWCMSGLARFSVGLVRAMGLARFSARFSAMGFARFSARFRGFS